jgi:Chromo (CHRromatin Organisation MOdifier) domain
LKIYPLQILAHRALKRNNVTLHQLQIKWSNLPAEDASWEDYNVLAKHYPSFILEDKNNFEERGLSGYEGEAQSIREESNSLYGQGVRARNADKELKERSC